MSSVHELNQKYLDAIGFSPSSLSERSLQRRDDTDDILNVFTSVRDILSGMFESISKSIRFVGHNWQFLVVGAIAIIILAKRI